MVSFIYKSLQYFITQRIPEIKYISLYNNQFNNSQTNRPIPYPAVLIEILPITFQNLANQMQYAEVNINLHFGTEIYNGFDRNDAMQDRSLEHLSLLDKLYVGLNRVNSEILPDEFKNEFYLQSAFNRTGLQLNLYNSVVNHSIITGKFIIYDSSAVKRYNEFELEDINVKSFYIPVTENTTVKELIIK